ncbi:Mitochondrial dicarboxylate transporter [Cytospora mali]|uniref:Mitochondrial dicarboxylate transporter n=1 Tax=Cytospora mali TaxID=578113 RepID=A0A194V1A9_CYTMA|nr:Mitochondrial dicarboxylate transporter [Valsa mali var. pyri (nom. inval.)]
MRSGDMPRSMLGTFKHVLGAHGTLGLYHGLSASLLRQLTYSTVRFGIYEEAKTRLTKQNGGTQPSFPVLVALSCTSGFMGGIAGNAADICNVRMQHDAVLPSAQRRNYKHALDGMVTMARTEGLMSWYRGVLPNSMRAAAMTASQLASYDTFKNLLIGYTPMKDNLSTHFTASFLAGAVAATVTSPVDVLKTRVMSQSGKSVSIGTLLREITAAEGLGWMFKGWVPSFLRLGPHTICTFIFLEMHRKAYRHIEGLDDPE